MFAMETWAMFGIVIVVFVLAPLHWRRLAANDLADLQQWFRERRESADDSLVCPKNNRVEERLRTWFMQKTPSAAKDHRKVPPWSLGIQAYPQVRWLDLSNPPQPPNFRR